jgi:hypothetical protein
MSTATQQNEFETSTGILWDDPEAGKTWLVALMGIAILAALVIAISVTNSRGPMPRVACAEWVTVEVEDMV